MQFHEPFPLDAPTSGDFSGTQQSHQSLRPFGARFAVDVPGDPHAQAEAERSYFDSKRQISVVDVYGIPVPMLKRGSGETTTTTNQDDRNAPDDDTDVGPNH